MKLVNPIGLSRSTFAHKMISSIAHRGAELLAPPVCALCGGPGQSADAVWGLDLCCHCEAACPPLRNPCPHCGLPLPLPGGGGCVACLFNPPPYDAVVAAYAYDHPVDHMVRELKFRHELTYARVLGMLLGQARRERAGPLPDVVIPLPLHRSRYVERGFNQAEEIARHAARALRLPVRSGVLQRRRATLEQSELDAVARQHNVRGAFELRRPPRAGSVALVDDVLTTGSTAAEAARVLKEAGVARIEVWVAARALPWRDP